MTGHHLGIFCYPVLNKPVAVIRNIWPLFFKQELFTADHLDHPATLGQREIQVIKHTVPTRFKVL